MKALSGRQPWWWLLLHGKMVENRHWNTNYRGPILLHAAKGCTIEEYDSACDFVEERFGIATAAKIPPLAELARGGIVGRARIIDVIPPWSAPLLEVSTIEAIDGIYSRWPNVDRRWHMPEQFGFVLADVEPLPFLTWRGKLGLFDIPDDYATIDNWIELPPARGVEVGK